MTMKFAPLFSGSSGNALYIGWGNIQLLVDAGVSGTRISQELRNAGVDITELNGILITHEHSDHISGVGVLSRRYNLPIYATEGTWDAMRAKLGRIEPCNERILMPGQDFFIGALNVMPFSIPHDAAQPVGYSFYGGGLKVSVATDIGCIREEWMCEVQNSDLLLLESNHDLDMLKAGRYPYELKRRIMGKKGHLSNEDAGLAVSELYRRGVRRVILGHLSGENNFPELALRTVENVLLSEGIRPGEDITLDVALRHAMSGIYSLSARSMEEVQYAGV